MWVKIKSNKIPNVVLTVPYSAFLNSYQHKGFYVIDGEKAKNKSTEKTETKIEISEQEKVELQELKNEFSGMNTVNEADKVEIVENKENPVLEYLQNQTGKEPEPEVKELPKYVSSRTSIKKAPSTKR